MADEGAQGRERQQRVGLAGGPANVEPGTIEAKREARTPEQKAAAEDRTEAVKAWAEEVNALLAQTGDLYNDLVKPLDGEPTPPEKALRDALHQVFSTSEVMAARQLANAIIHDDPVIHPVSSGPAVQSYPTPTQGAAVSTDVPTETQPTGGKESAQAAGTTKE